MTEPLPTSAPADDMPGGGTNAMLPVLRSDHERQPQPYPIEHAGDHYVCARCGEVIMDGALVRADYDEENNLVGVHADTNPDSADYSIVHECGTLATPRAIEAPRG